MPTTELKRRVGILGGMGPEATVLLMARVIAMTDARDDHDHVPLMVDNNTQVPSRIKAILDKTGENPGPTLAKMAVRLAENNAEALAMPCNTAHYYAAFIEDSVNIPLLNMIDLAADRVAGMDLEGRAAGLLASPAVQCTGIFDQAFTKRRIRTVYPADQNEILSAIRTLKSDSESKGARKTLKNAACELMDAGVDVLLIACSELSIIAKVIPENFPRLDTIDVLAEEIIKFSGAKSK
jgi:aspartate racemase